jgi:hypothetical protein
LVLADLIQVAKALKTYLKANTIPIVISHVSAYKPYKGYGQPTLEVVKELIGQPVQPLRVDKVGHVNERAIQIDRAAKADLWK